MARDSVQNKINRKIRIHWYKSKINNTYWFEKILRVLFKKGRKHFALNSILGSMRSLKTITVVPFFFFFEAVEKVRPVILLRLQRKGKQYYQIPTVVKKYRQYKVGLKWLITSMLRNNSRSLSDKVYKELVNTVVEESSPALKRQELLYKVALENRAFTHYRWGL